MPIDMKILVIESSPRKKGNSNILAESFIKGAREAGHEVNEFDCGRSNIKGCLACNGCIRTGKCVQKDGYEELVPLFIEADVVVFVTPIYYFSCSAQLKAVIDRFFCIYFGENKDNPKLFNKRSVLITTQGQPSLNYASPTIEMYKDIVNFHKWQDAGQVHALGIIEPGAVSETRYPQEAYELGKNL